MYVEPPMTAAASMSTLSGAARLYLMRERTKDRNKLQYHGNGEKREPTVAIHTCLIPDTKQ